MYIYIIYIYIHTHIQYIYILYLLHLVTQLGHQRLRCNANENQFTLSAHVPQARLRALTVQFEIAIKTSLLLQQDQSYSHQWSLLMLYDVTCLFFEALKLF